MFANRLSKVTLAVSLVVVAAALAAYAAMAGSIVTPRSWASNPWCFQTGEQYQLCAHGR